MKMKKTSLNTTKVTDRKIKRLYLVAATVVAAAFVMAMPAFADDHTLHGTGFPGVWY